ncbi:MAG TPA: tetratricopeptide repeat protein [Thermoanaerobaculia bacterium]
MQTARVVWAALLFGAAPLTASTPATPDPALCEIRTVWSEVRDMGGWRSRIVSAVGHHWVEASSRDRADATIVLRAIQPRGQWAFDAIVRTDERRPLATFRGPTRKQTNDALDALAREIRSLLDRCPPRDDAAIGNLIEVETQPLVANTSPETDSLAEHASRLHAEGDYAGAIRLLRRYLRLLPDDSYGHANLSLAHMARGEWQAAAGALERSVEINTQNDVALFNLAYCYWKLDRPREARRRLDEALTLNPAYEKALQLQALLRQ